MKASKLTSEVQFRNNAFGLNDSWII